MSRKEGAVQHDLTATDDSSAEPAVASERNQQLAAWLQARGGVTEWFDITSLSRASIHSVAINSLYFLKIVPCLINGMACSTPIYKGAVWKPEWLKRLRDYIAQGGGSLNESDKQRKLNDLDKEKHEILGMDHGKSWDVVKANLERHLQSLKDDYMRAAGTVTPALRRITTGKRFRFKT